MIDMEWHSPPLIFLSSPTSNILVKNIFQPVFYNEYMFALPCNTFDELARLP